MFWYEASQPVLSQSLSKFSKSASQSLRPSIREPVSSETVILYLSIYVSTALIDLGLFISFLIYTQSLGALGQVISPSQGHYLHTGQHKHRIKAHRHPYLKWDSNSRS